MQTVSYKFRYKHLNMWKEISNSYSIRFLDLVLRILSSLASLISLRYYKWAVLWESAFCDKWIINKIRVRALISFWIQWDLGRSSYTYVEQLDDRIEADAALKFSDRQKDSTWIDSNISYERKVNRKAWERFRIISWMIIEDYFRQSFVKWRWPVFSYKSYSFVASVQMYLSSYAANKTVNILHGEEFERANGCLKGMVVKFLKANT